MLYPMSTPNQEFKGIILVSDPKWNEICSEGFTKLGGIRLAQSVLLLSLNTRFPLLYAV